MDLQQKAREALVSNFNEDTAEIILSLTWHDLGIDSDEPVFLIGHPEQYLPQKVRPDDEYDLTLEQIALAKAMWQDKYRRTVQ